MITQCSFSPDIISGLFSPSQSALFREFGRIKGLFVTAYDKLGRIVFEGPSDLEDTPQLQQVDVLAPGYGMDGKIVEIYPGTTYDDAAATPRLRVCWSASKGSYPSFCLSASKTLAGIRGARWSWSARSLPAARSKSWSLLNTR